MTDDTLPALEMCLLVIECVVNVIALFFLIAYCRSTRQIAESTRQTVKETAAMSKITSEMLESSKQTLVEMRRSREAQWAPYVFVYFDNSSDIKDSTTISLIIKNSGKGTARNVSVKFEPKLQNSSIYNLKHINYWINHLPPMPPGKEVRHVFESTIEYFNSEVELPLRYHVSTSFDDGTTQRRYEVEQELSFEFFTGLRINKIEPSDDV